MSSANRSTMVEGPYPVITDARITEHMVTAVLSDGREISMPIIWSERLRGATREQLEEFEIIGCGDGIHWEAVDEQISVRAFINGWH